LKKKSKNLGIYGSPEGGFKKKSRRSVHAESLGKKKNGLGKKSFRHWGVARSNKKKFARVMKKRLTNKG